MNNCGPNSRRLFVLLNKLDTITELASREEASRFSSSSLEKPTKENVSPNFSKAFISSSESIILYHKKCSRPLHHRNSEDVNFSQPLNDASVDSFARPNEISTRTSPNSKLPVKAADFFKAYETNSSKTSTNSKSPEKHTKSSNVFSNIDTSMDDFVCPGIKKQPGDKANFSKAFYMSGDSLLRDSRISISGHSAVESKKQSSVVSSQKSADSFRGSYKMVEIRNCTIDSSRTSKGSSKKSNSKPNQLADRSKELSFNSHNVAPVYHSSSSSTISSRRCSTPVKGMSQKTQDDLDLSYILPYAPLLEETDSSSKLTQNEKTCPNANLSVAPLPNDKVHQSRNFSHPNVPVSSMNDLSKHSRCSDQVEPPPALNRNESKAVEVFNMRPNSEENPERSNNESFYGDNRAHNSTSSSCNTLSFVSRVFHARSSSPGRESSSEQKLSPERTDAKKRIKINYEGLPRNPKFPKFDHFCNKRFYHYLVTKLGHKYGIKTNRKVVQLARSICKMVKNIMSVPEIDLDLVDDFKVLLFRKKVVHTHLEFFQFCLKFLPAQIAWRTVPMIRPVNTPSVEFDWEKVCDPVE